MARVRRYFRTMPPSMQEMEWRNQAKAMPLDELRLLAGVIQYELDEREGRQKYQIPAHVQAMLN
jgi:hypothetical protein